MKIFKYFISKIFLRKAVLGISMILLLCMANYITFTSSRSILSTYQGYQETKYINQEGNYIANLDPDSHMDMGLINENGTQAVYSYLNSYYNYAFYVDGFIVSVPNVDDMEVHLSYMNEKYYKLKQFELLQGVDLGFDYQLDDEIPVLVGKGLSKTYPVGSTIRMKDFTINLLVGLSYSKLRKIFYIYFGMLSFINLAVVFIFTAFNRYGCWIRKDATFVTYGLFGLIGMDWLALLVVVLLDIIIGIMIVETMLRKIKRMPISLGVLQ